MSGWAVQGRRRGTGRARPIKLAGSAHAVPAAQSLREGAPQAWEGRRRPTVLAGLDTLGLTPTAILKPSTPACLSRVQDTPSTSLRPRPRPQTLRQPLDHNHRRPPARPRPGRHKAAGCRLPLSPRLASPRNSSAARLESRLAPWL